MFLLYMCFIFYNLYHRKLLLPTSSEEFKILEEGPLRVSVEVSVGTTVTVDLLARKISRVPGLTAKIAGSLSSPDGTLIPP